MPDAPSKVTPPYLSYITFKNSTKGLMADGIIPRQIDHSILTGLSGSVRKMFLSALRFFALTDEAGKPNDNLATLAAADDATWRDCVGTMLKEEYGNIVELLADASPKQIREEFEKQFSGIGNSILGPAIRFLVAASADAGFPISPHMKQRKGRPPGARQRTKKTPKHNRSLTTVPEQDGARPAGSVAMALLDKFPKFDPSWGAEEQKAWFDAYAKLIDFQKELSQQNS